MSGARTIWKFTLPITDTVKVRLPAAAGYPEPRILHVADAEHGRFYLWAEVVPGGMFVDEHTLSVFGTGHPMPEFFKERHLGTILAPPFVWHVYDNEDATHRLVA